MTTPVGLEPTLPKEIDTELEVLVNRLNHSAKVSLFDERMTLILKYIVHKLGLSMVVYRGNFKCSVPTSPPELTRSL